MPTNRQVRDRRVLLWGRVALLALLAAAVADQALAAGSSGGAMPWDSKLQAIADSITGPVAKAIGVIAIAMTGLGVALSEGGSWVRRGFAIVFGLSIAFTASSFGMTFLEFSGGAGF